MSEKWDENTYKTLKYACLNCGYKVDAATPTPLEPEPREPREGDATVCLRCSHIMIFTADGRVREATQDERDEVASQPDVQSLLQAMAEVRR